MTTKRAWWRDYAVALICAPAGAIVGTLIAHTLGWVR